MGEIIARNMLSWLKLLIKLVLLHLVGCLYYRISDARSHKHQIPCRSGNSSYTVVFTTGRHCFPVGQGTRSYTVVFTTGRHCFPVGQGTRSCTVVFTTGRHCCLSIDTPVWSVTSRCFFTYILYCLPTLAVAVPCWSPSFIFPHRQLFLLLHHILYRHHSNISHYSELITLIIIRAVNFQTLNSVQF